MKSNEMKKQSKQVMLYPGRDDAYNYRAIPLRNTVVAGFSGSGKTTFMNNLILRLITEYSPETIQINYWDGLGEEFIKWFPKTQGKISRDRKLPHFQSISHGADCIKTNGLLECKSADMFIADILSEIECRESKWVDMQLRNTPFPTAIYIIDEIHHVFNWDILYDVLARCEYVNVFCIITSQGSRINHPRLVSACRNRICLRNVAEISELLLGCNIAASEDMPKHGMCYYKDALYKRAPEAMYIPFIPETLIMKMVGAFSVRIDD